ncbi:transposase [Funiculus sociatus GB1-A4]
MQQAIGKGRQQDLKIFKKSKIIAVSRIQIVADKGYQGIKKYHHNNSKIPHKRPRNSQLSAKQKRENRSLAKLNIKVEHTIRCLKTFRILSSLYRNRSQRFGLRVNLIAGIYNYELKIAKSS